MRPDRLELLGALEVAAAALRRIYIQSGNIEAVGPYDRAQELLYREKIAADEAGK